MTVNESLSYRRSAQGIGPLAHRYGRSTGKQPSVKANGNGPGSPVGYSPSKNTSARFGTCSSNWNDGFHGPEYHPRSSAVIICMGSLHSESTPDGRSVRHHHRPVSEGRVPLPIQTRE